MLDLFDLSPILSIVVLACRLNGTSVGKGLVYETGYCGFYPTA